MGEVHAVVIRFFDDEFASDGEEAVSSHVPVPSEAPLRHHFGESCLDLRRWPPSIARVSDTVLSTRRSPPIDGNDGIPLGVSLEVGKDGRYDLARRVDPESRAVHRHDADYSIYAQPPSPANGDEFLQLRSRSHRSRSTGPDSWLTPQSGAPRRKLQRRGGARSR